MIGSIAAGVAPFAVDALTGASKKKDAAYSDYIKSLSGIMSRIKSDMGASATDSLLFKTNKALIDRSAKQQNDVMMQNNAATGASSEMQLGGLNTLNDAYFNAMLRAVSGAEQRRQQLQSEYDKLTLSRAEMGMAKANEDAGMVDKLSTGLTTLLPQFDGSLDTMFGVKKSKEG